MGLPTSPTVRLSLRSYANPGIGVIVWLLQRPAVLPTSALAAMAGTELQSVQLTHPASAACHRSILLTLPHLGPAASPVVCRRPHPLVLFFFLSSFCSSHTPMGSWTKYCIGSSSRVIKIVVPIVIICPLICTFGGFWESNLDLPGAVIYWHLCLLFSFLSFQSDSTQFLQSTC